MERTRVRPAIVFLPPLWKWVSAAGQFQDGNGAGVCLCVRVCLPPLLSPPPFFFPEVEGPGPDGVLGSVPVAAPPLRALEGPPHPVGGCGGVPPLPRGNVPERCPCQWIGFKKIDVGVNITFQTKKCGFLQSNEISSFRRGLAGDRSAPLCSPNFTPRKHFMFSLFHWLCN